MTEPIRTLIFVCVAALIGLVAWASRPQVEALPGAVNEIGQPLFKDFTDPSEASSLEIVQFDESSAELRAFRIAQKNGVWVLPSHGNYPADAEQQLAAAARSLIGLEIEGIASEVATEHAEFKVLEPDQKKLNVGDKNVGTLISLQNAKGDDVFRLIVGDKVEGQPDLRFVRKPSQEVVYVTKLSLDNLPTEFDKWIEKDLLKINTFDVARVMLKDYSILPTQSGDSAFSPRMEATAVWKAEQSAWELENLRLFSAARGGGEWIDAALGEQEELNTQKLNDLKTALDDLKIVDVVRKPEGLGESLKAGNEIFNNRELIDSLATFGFLPARLPGMDKPEIFATNGEVIVDMKDGVQYALRFGKVEGAQRSTEPAKPGESEEIKLNRYLFVTARLSPHTLVEPTYEPEPAGPEGAPAAEGDKPADAKPADATGSEDQKDDAAKPAAANPADPKAAERDRIKRENERKRNEYNDKRKKAEARVAELNGRFADWYYVISEDVYKKVHLGRADLIKEGATARESGFNVDAFRKLENEGVKGAPEPPAAPSSPGFPGGLPPGFPPM